MPGKLKDVFGLLLPYNSDFYTVSLNLVYCPLFCVTWNYKNQTKSIFPMEAKLSEISNAET